ncbi:MAG: ribonuclease P protein component [Acidobacteria bacterium]|nr:ribonuclease P protein component [Acidobacteriota bacterium]
MRFRGCFRVVRRSDRAVPVPAPRPRPACAPLDVRVWASGGEPLLLVNASRRQGGAVQRNRFRRRVRMAFLALVREGLPGGTRLGVVWVRPAQGFRLDGKTPSFQEIVRLLRSALCGQGNT